jgi:hypothetical protein
VIRNETSNANHWFEIRVQGVTTNRDGVGTQITLSAGDVSRTAEVHSGRGYQSHYGSRLHFGLGKQQQIDRIIIRWLGGDESIFEHVPSDRAVLVRQGSRELVVCNATTHNRSPSNQKSGEH